MNYTPIGQASLARRAWWELGTVSKYYGMDKGEKERKRRDKGKGKEERVREVITPLLILNHFVVSSSSTAVHSKSFDNISKYKNLFSSSSASSEPSHLLP